MRKIICFTLIGTFCIGVMGGCAMKTNIAGSGAEKAGTDSFAVGNADSEKTETAVSYDTNMETAEEIKYEYETHELYAENDGKQIYGVVYVPQNAGDRIKMYP